MKSLYMRNLVTLNILLSLFFSACQKEENVAELPTKIAVCDNCINFQSPQVGQESRYLAFEGNRYQDNRESKYKKDTLVVKVTAQNGSTFLFEEFLTSNPDSIRNYKVMWSQDSIKISLPSYYGDSWLFYGGYKPFLNIALEPEDADSIELKGWEAFIICDTAPCYGYLPEHAQQQSRYENLYVYHDYGPIASDGTGYFAIFNKKFGVVRSATAGGWVPIANGWDLILK